MITLENVNKYFNRKKKNEIHVINNTSLELPDKGLVALLGPSGCGKTTLLNAIGGLDKVKSGKIYINGKKITRKSSHYVDKVRNLNIGYIFQNYYLLDNETVFDNVAISLKMTGIKSKSEIKKRVNYVLETLGIYRYRNRPAGMLSGGERQRVGIARAIVKDPSIIIADEPTGNLDSGNTIEIMNIIKSISNNRLVILVTHETPLAKFYADRIVEIEDGCIKKDYLNETDENLDYRIENEFYLKDFKHLSHFENEDNNIDIYNDKKNDIKLTIVVKNNNIYIKAGKNDKIEVVDNDSNIKFINDHYKQIDKSVYEKYEFNFSSVITKNEKLRYTSIINVFQMLIKGFKKVFSYSFLKKLLLIGFFGSGLFISYSVCNMFGMTHRENSYFIEYYDRYYQANISNLTPDKFSKLESLENVEYILPGNSNISFMIRYPYYFQTMNAQDQLTGSLTSIEEITKDDIIAGRMPENDYEIVVDKLTFDIFFDMPGAVTNQAGYNTMEDYIGKDVELKHMNPFTIVGISDTDTPAIFASKSLLITMLANTNNTYSDMYSIDSYGDESTFFISYNLVNNLTVTKGRLPENDYEIMLNKKFADSYQLNKTIDYKLGDTKLTVVGFYESEDLGTSAYVSNDNTVKINSIYGNKTITVLAKDDTTIKDDFLNESIQLRNTYEKSLSKYNKEVKSSVRTGLIISGIILLVSFIEIFLMVRSSFLSRIKEVGMYRAIGVKKTDIYKMFAGEIFAITTIACVPGVLFMGYALKVLTVVSYFEKNYLINGLTIGISLLLVYVFNLLVGLIPVRRLVRHTPAEILARKDLD